ncbi:DUF975 family protein [Paenibacillus sp. SYP-B3998]|uniref:DUF975 family protein n=1 Tax=Paenibacillus sp. SYP-B3998 TaxID=2678564 RepID=A0A6G3ZS49_9BACL|nr:DUF975 family protein [Paenibacillus sp. SYP-B3998]NEW04945.1 DUF975 family protein [Paenibacillus sp. SYP-B3998]
MWSRSDLKTRAKETLRSSYWKAFIISLLLAIVGGEESSIHFDGRVIKGEAWNLGNSFTSLGNELFWLILGVVITSALVIFIVVFALRIFLGYPLEIGAKRYFKQAAEQDVDLNHVGFAFEQSRYLDTIKAMFWRDLLNLLWFLLLIIPGFVKSYAYSMVPYILADNPHIGYKRAVGLSNEMTDGHKTSMFVLDLSFIGWYLLGTLALFVGVIFVWPYVNATKAELYLTLRQRALEYGISTTEELRLQA